MVKLRQGKAEEAQQDFKKAVELEPSLKGKLEPLMNEQKTPPAQR
jgi:Tfp pilus assembly protein PilF